VDAAPQVASHGGHGGDPRRPPQVGVHVGEAALADGQLGAPLPRQGARPGPEGIVQHAAPLQAPVALLPATLQQQRFAQQAPGERLGPDRPRPLRLVEDPPRVSFDGFEQAVAVEVILTDAVMDVEDPGQLAFPPGGGQPLQLGLQPRSPFPFEMRHDG
jgi:hypothetical protein